jgi:integrase
MLAQTKRRPKRPAHKRRLTELFVRKTKPRDSAYLVWDVLQRALVLRVQPSGTRTWYTVYSRHGRPRWLRHGDASAIALSDARTLSAEAMLAVAKGGDPAAEKKAERGAGTFAELHERYLEQHAKKHNRSWAQADALVRRHAIPRWGKLQASAITRGDIKQMMARIEAPIAANQTLAAVSAIFSWGVKEEICAANPCKLVERNPVKSRDRVLSESELPLVWKALDDIDPVRAAVLRVILCTGQRPGEISHMLYQHIKDGSWWELPGAPVGEWPGTKNKASHRVFLCERVQDLMPGDAAKAGFVFAGPRGSKVANLDETMRAISKKLGIEPVRPHDLRRTFGSMVTGCGFGRQAMDRILNHADHSTGSVYDRHSYAQEDRAIMETVAAKIMALVEGRAADNVVTLQRPATGA